MASFDTPGSEVPAGLPAGRGGALFISAGGYADGQLARLRPPARGVADLAAALGSAAGGFAVSTLTDPTLTEASLGIASFLAERAAGETAVLYLACHAIRDRTRTYFAVADTWLRYPGVSAVPAADVLAGLDRCRARHKVLILDCCFIGGLADDKTELDLGTEFALDGRGIAVLTGSRAREYTYSGVPLTTELPASAFTAGLAEGLTAGVADADMDGRITVADAYDHAYRYVRRHAPGQAPQYYLDAGLGAIVLAESPSVATRPGAGSPGSPASPGGAGSWGPGHDAELLGSWRRPPDFARLGAATRPPRQHRAPPATAAGMPPGSRPPGSAAPGRGAGPARGTLAGSAALARSVTRMSGTGSAIVDHDKDNAYCVAFSADGALLASGAWGRPARLRDAMTGELVRELRGAGASSYDMAFSPDSRLLAVGSRDGSVTLCEVGTGKRTRARKPGAAVRAMAFSPDGALLAAACDDGVLRLWDAATLSRSRELRADGETIFGAAFSPDGTLLAAACADGMVRLWWTADGELAAADRRHTGWATGVAFSPDGGRIVSSGAGSTVLVHDVASGRLLSELRAGDGIINAIALTADGELLAGGYESGAVTIWDLFTGQHETLTGHSGFVNDVAFSPDGRLLASAGKDGTIRLWR